MCCTKGNKTPWDWAAFSLVALLTFLTLTMSNILGEHLWARSKNYNPCLATFVSFLIALVSLFIALAWQNLNISSMGS